MQEICQSGSVGGVKSSIFIPTPIPPQLRSYSVMNHHGLVVERLFHALAPA